jgi:uncharacterized membrane protein required for colicin V production
MFIDILLLLLFVVIAAVGFFQGTIRLTIALVTFYASIILASLYFRFLASYFSNTNPVIASAISFFLILMIAFAALLAMALYTFRYIRMPGQLEVLDRVLGVTLGVLFGVVLTSVFAMVLQYAFITHSVGNAYPITRALQGSTRSSTLLPLLLSTILPQIFNAVSPFLPDAALPFFRPGA